MFTDHVVEAKPPSFMSAILLPLSCVCRAERSLRVKPGNTLYAFQWWTMQSSRYTHIVANTISPRQSMDIIARNGRRRAAHLCTNTYTHAHITSVRVYVAIPANGVFTQGKLMLKLLFNLGYPSTVLGLTLHL